MNFQKEFDILFAAILTDWRNQYPEADLSQGSLIYIKSACLASALWGLYKYQDWIALQIFPDTAETQYLEHHAWVRGISRTVGETDAAYLARLLDYIRRPPAGGNRYDYIKWALSIDGVAAAYCIPLGLGLGTVDVVILADETITGSELPSNYKISGTATSLTAGKLVDSAANFLGPGVKVRIGDIVVNDDLATFAKVIAIDSPTQLALDTNIFTAEAQVYTLNSLILAGAVTATATNKLIDSAANFLAAQATVRIGDIVTNGVSSKQATVTAIDGTTQLSLNTDIFTVAAEAYTLKSLTTQVKEYIDDVRPVTASAVRVLPPAITSQDVTLAVSGDNLDKTQIGSEISAYISNLEPGETLYLSRLTAIAIEAGAINAVASVPAADVTPAVKEMLRPGTITVT
jgi:uncharacterized phage protein gp47/JayE